MKNIKILLIVGQAGLVLGAWLAMSGCASYVETPGGGVYVAPPTVEVGVEDNYIYYPAYDVYYNPHLREFAYMDGGVWVNRPEPVGVSIDVLMASPSVKMDFHDSPANHHEEVARQYPRNWTPSRAPQAQRAEVRNPQAAKTPVKKAPVKKPDQKDDKHDEVEGK